MYPVGNLRVLSQRVGLPKGYYLLKTYLLFYLVVESLWYSIRTTGGFKELVLTKYCFQKENSYAKQAYLTVILVCRFPKL
jgi:hypothetical protein